MISLSMNLNGDNMYKEAVEQRSLKSYYEFNVTSQTEVLMNHMLQLVSVLFLILRMTLLLIQNRLKVNCEAILS